LNAPLGTVLADNNRYLVEPFLVEYHGGKDSDRRTRSVDEPIPTQDTSNRLGLAEPFLVNYYGNGKPLSLLDPMDTITSKDHFALVEPFLVKFYGGHTACTVDLPLGTITANYEHYGLARPELLEGSELRLDIRFRMLRPHELAAAHSFPFGYQFAGNNEDAVKMIGNSVPCLTAQALCDAAIWGNAQ
jgi:DNA (cytosine-5)-methyltransferase 1